MADRELTLYHAPNTRSTGTLILLEELGVPYRLEIVNLKTGAQHEPAYLAVNPMGKVPALKHGDALVTEQVAVYLYLADLFPKAKLAPAIDDPLRGPYLLGMRFLAVDVLWGTALGWITHFGLIPAVPVIQSYVERVNARPAFVKARARDAELAAA